VRTTCSIAALVGLVMTTGWPTTIPAAPARPAPVSSELMDQTPADLIAAAETLHPAALYVLAAKLLQSGQNDDAVFWFHVGQLRYRFMLATLEGQERSDAGILFSALSENVGRPINEWAFGDVDAAVATIDAALAWDAAHDNPVTSKTAHPAELAEVRAGLVELRDRMAREKDHIRTQRTRNGLPNQ
jgi:hypothetical protein